MSISSFTSFCYVAGFLVIISIILKAFWYVMIPLIIVIALAVLCLAVGRKSDNMPAPTFRSQMPFRPSIAPRPVEPREERQLRNRIENEWERQSRFGSPEDLR